MNVRELQNKLAQIEKRLDILERGEFISAEDAEELEKTTKAE